MTSSGNVVEPTTQGGPVEIIVCAFCRTRLEPDHTGPCPECGGTNKKVQTVEEEPESEPESIQ
jgi:hypothetical protein